MKLSNLLLLLFLSAMLAGQAMPLSPEPAELPAGNADEAEQETVISTDDPASAEAWRMINEAMGADVG
ncbi:MAG TPA: hypothetical protein ENN07_01995, partial [candidate division Zixibacteria bacterium]|nr:hypothetical protein [candidate division Zixibacteria bacterium]